MALRGKTPEVVKGRFKAIFYGKEKVGKTTCAASFPAPYIIDAERRLKHQWHVDIVKANKGAYVQLSNYDEIVQEVKELIQAEHSFKTLVIDSLTVVQNELVEALKPTVKDQRQAYAEAYSKLRKLIQLLNRLDMNVIVIAHKKDDYDKVSDTVIGSTFDAHKDFGYMMDAILEIEKRGKSYYAIPRGAVGPLGDAEAFEFKYQKFVDIFGVETFEAESKPEVLANPDQIEELKFLLAKHQVSDATKSAWLSRAKASNFSEMAADKMQAWIDHLAKKMPKKTLVDESQQFDSPVDSIDNK
jgi:uncharacterized coiled-coil protein SlyX